MGTSGPVYAFLGMVCTAHLVRVITDDLEYQIWVVATSRDHAVARVLECVPEGWSASLLDQIVDPTEAAVLELHPGDARKLRG